MCPELLHIYGPFSIHAYGLMIVLGVLVFSWLFLCDNRSKRYVTEAMFAQILFISIVTGVIGGRLLEVLMNRDMYSLVEIFALWEGGFSILGAILAILCVLPFYLRKLRVPIIPFLDIAATYAPLLQSISRVGCFFAGCCFGLPTTGSTGVLFLYPIDSRYEGIAVHPTQLYSALLLLLIFLFMYAFVRTRSYRPGVAAAWYIGLAGLERFLVDFLRADRMCVERMPWLSCMQMIALSMMIGALIVVIWIKYRYRSLRVKHL